MIHGFVLAGPMSLNPVRESEAMGKGLAVDDERHHKLIKVIEKVT
jgi:hypothetical protein